MNGPSEACSFTRMEYAWPGLEELALSIENLSIGTGQWVALLGANGSGKSTLARLCNALLIPTQGDCFVLGYNTRNEHTVNELRRHVSMVFQNPDNQIVASVVEEEVAFGPENLGLPTEEIRRRVNWALDVVGLCDMRRAATYSMSGGQKQRLALAGALAMDSDILILDEATSMIDPQGRKDFMNVMCGLKGRKTLIQITHHLDEIYPADRVIVLHKGRVSYDGDTPDFFRDENRVSSLGLSMPPLVQIKRSLVLENILDESVAVCADSMACAICP